MLWVFSTDLQHSLLYNFMCTPQAAGNPSSSDSMNNRHLTKEGGPCSLTRPVPVLDCPLPSLTCVGLSGDEQLLGSQGRGADVGVEIVGFVQSALEDLVKVQPKGVSLWLALLIRDPHTHANLLPGRDVQDVVRGHFSPPWVRADGILLLLNDVAGEKERDEEKGGTGKME